ncbi:MAG TPA: hypothetical protein H9950_07010 [Candidatus Bacteroides avicola]|uniref:Uncharacterized protein n=1 Tax=Candidatus Bacteroides avicola TaxID=2838468 RepID=A0A9D2KW71_9BACE|nr:hypothetical protein [Candidatus Bacteroides avicola]
MEHISIFSPEINGNRIIIRFECSPLLKRYFPLSTFEISYSESIEKVPASIAVIPLICNLLPIVWLTDSTLKVDALDEDFYESINNFKQGYIDMYPQMVFHGKIEVKSIEKNEFATIDNKAAAFFSGGVDAFATLIAHIDERPTLLTVRGSDITLDDEEGWNNVTKHVEETCFELGCNHIYISSNFRMFLDEGLLSQFVAKSGDGWWHGFQHGIGLLGLAAPISFIEGFTTIYIASSYTATDHVTCASHPSIDNNVRYGGSHIKHDQYEFTRQAKLTHICEFVRKSQKRISLRVCWMSRGGGNCCTCEKCLRTIYGILAEGEDPIRMGFPQIAGKYEAIKKQIQHQIIFNFISIPFWIDIQKRFIENKDKLNYGSDINWIYEYDFHKANHTLRKQAVILYAALRRQLSHIKKLFLS